MTCKNGKKQETCELCPPGTYHSQGDCVQCPKGTYSTRHGISSIAKCTFCKYGTFNDVKGSTFCKDCPIAYFCPIGSSYPKNISIKSASGTIQPESWVFDTDKYNTIMYQVLFFTIITYILLLIILFYVESFRYFIKLLDLFVNRHIKPLNQPVILRRTYIGGIYSSIFILFAFITTIFGIYTYTKGHIEERKTLIPITLVKDSIISESLSIRISLNSFSATCTEDNECMTLKYFNQSGFEFDEVLTKCKLIGDDCTVKREYKNFKLNSDGNIYFLFNDVLAFANSISINISSSSSIPNQPSSIMIYQSPPNETLVFKGVNPSIFKFELIPSVIYMKIFTSDSSNWPSKLTGYHILNTNSHTIGTTIDNEK